MSTPDAKSSKSPDSRDLTEDVILEILLSLPVKSLVRLKCVCKQWYTIIESQSFIEQHFGHRSNQERLLVRHYKLNENCETYALFVDDTCSAFEEPPHLQIPNMLSQLFGPVNGVFCLVGRCSNLALLNPATRQLKPLPELPAPYLRCVCNVLGFGLVPLSRDYKVVSIRFFRDNVVNTSDWHSIVYVYSLGSDSWRKLKNVDCFKSRYWTNMSYCNTYLNGVYYWTMGETAHSHNVYAILAFDMTTEKFQEIQVPDCLKLKFGQLTIHGDSIALLSYDLKMTSCEVWVMEKEGSWNRVAVVGSYEDMAGPLCLWKNNVLLIANKTRFLMQCNIFTKKWQKVSRYISWVSSYKENLFSIKGKRDNCLLWDASPDIFTVAWPKED